MLPDEKIEQMKPVPSKKWYLISAALFVVFVAGMVLFVVCLVTGITGGKQYIAPGQENTVQIQKEGSYNIFYEYEFAQNLQGVPNFTFTHTDTGRVFTSHIPAGGQSYRVNNLYGVRIGAVDLPAGQYSAITNYTGPPATFVLQRGSGGIALAIVGLVVAFICFFAAVISLILIGGWRSKIMLENARLEAGEEYGWQEADEDEDEEEDDDEDPFADESPHGGPPV